MATDVRPKSFEYMENNKGDKFSPCLPPALQVKKSDKLLQQCTAGVTACSKLVTKYIFFSGTGGGLQTPKQIIMNLHNIYYPILHHFRDTDQNSVIAGAKKNKQIGPSSRHFVMNRP